MERDFELEFKKLKLNETPDLWSRIEAGLTEKTPVTAISADKGLSDGKYKSVKKIAWRRWGTLAAACLCVVLILPAISFVISNMGGRKNIYYSTSYAPAADTNGSDRTQSETSYMTEASETPDMSSEAAETTDMSDMAGASESSNMSGRAEVSETPDMLNGAADNSYIAADNSMSAQDSDDLDMTRQDETADSISDMAKQMESMREQAEKEAAYMEDGKSVDNVVVEIEAVHKSGGEIIYEAVVKQSDTEGLLSADAKISIVCDSDTKYGLDKNYSGEQTLKVGEKYKVSLQYEQNVQDSASGRFVVVMADKE